MSGLWGGVSGLAEPGGSLQATCREHAGGSAGGMNRGNEQGTEFCSRGGVSLAVRPASCLVRTKHAFDGLASMVGWFSLPASERETDEGVPGEHEVGRRMTPNGD